jgi:hypothetical protein
MPVDYKWLLEAGKNNWNEELKRGDFYS